MNTGKRSKEPLMLDTKRMAIWDGPGIRTIFFVKDRRICDRITGLELIVIEGRGLWLMKS